MTIYIIYISNNDPSHVARGCGYNTNRFIFVILTFSVWIHDHNSSHLRKHENICKDKVQHFKFSNANSEILYYVQNLCKQKSPIMSRARCRWLSLQCSAVWSFLLQPLLLFLSTPFSLLPLIGDAVNNRLQRRVRKNPFPLWEEKIRKIV